MNLQKHYFEKTGYSRYCQTRNTLLPLQSSKLKEEFNIDLRVLGIADSKRVLVDERCESSSRGFLWPATCPLQADTIPVPSAEQQSFCSSFCVIQTVNYLCIKAYFCVFFFCCHVSDPLDSLLMYLLWPTFSGRSSSISTSCACLLCNFLGCLPMP